VLRSESWENLNANKGTIFLDEVADLSPHAQAALLRVIQQKEITRLGGQKIIPVDVRILCASNRNLEQLWSTRENSG